MLREIQSVKQNRDELFRRWFEDDFFDLFVWYDQQEKISGFQLCYEKCRDEHALTWREDCGYALDRIDSGERSVWETSTPVLLPSNDLPPEKVIETFVARSEAVDPQLVEFVVQKISEYAREMSEEES
jgi:hypothetical protein